MRAAADGIDRDALSDLVYTLREGREAEERDVAQEAAREQEWVKELARQQEIERQAERDRGQGLER
ncbi:hypothetical protein ACLGGT_20525 [Roseovarius sp. MS2]|uniref:hypothetical protein n=1 Tax=Roseovarius sp. MS2 TaxID=3390728 RepID=UPI003EDC5E48